MLRNRSNDHPRYPEVPEGRDQLAPVEAGRRLKAAAGGLRARHRLGTLSCSPVPEKLAQVEISFLARLILTWSSSLMSLTPRAYVCSVRRKQGLGKDHFSELAARSTCEMIVQTPE